MSVTKRHRPGHREKMLVHSVKAAYWLTETDKGAVAAARSLAAEMDSLIRSRSPQAEMFEVAAARSGKLAYLESTLQRAMNDLGLTPKGRSELGFIMDEMEVNPLDDLRADVVQLEAVRSSDAEDRDATDTGS